MTIKVDIIILADNGDIVDKTFIGIKNYEDFNNLITVRNKFFEMYDHPMLLWRNKSDHAYAYPEHIPTWMWDMKTENLLPNKFTKSKQ